MSRPIISPAGSESDLQDATSAQRVRTRASAVRSEDCKGITTQNDHLYFETIFTTAYFLLCHSCKAATLCIRWTFPSSFVEEEYCKEYFCRSCCATVVRCFHTLQEQDDTRLTSLRKVLGFASNTSLQNPSGTIPTQKKENGRFN